MHLGYHELRNMLQKFKDERDKRKMTAPSSAISPSAGAPLLGGGLRPGDRGGDYRGKDDYRDRERYDRGGERGSAAPSGRYE